MEDIKQQTEEKKNTSGTSGGKTSKKKQSTANSGTSKKTSTTKETEVKETVKETVVPKDIDASQYVVVRNGFQGRLVYKSKRTGELFIWDEFGAEQEMELRELRSAKNTYKKFFQYNWFMFDEDWVIDYLGVKQFYKNAIKIEQFDELFDKSTDEIEEIISGMSIGQKKSIAYRARQLIIDGTIDSRKKVLMLEKTLGIELIEK